jgi:hypothetical protein
MGALKLYSGNFEAACYLGYVGFVMAKTEGNRREMRLSIENLRTAQRLYPSSEDLKTLIQTCESAL